MEPIAQLEEAMDRLAHAQREPLAAILGFADILTRAPTGPAETAHAGGRILAAAQMLDRRVEEALAYARAATDPLRLEPTDCEALVEDALGGVPPRSAGLSDPSGKLPTVTGDRAKLATVFATLVSLALTTATPGGAGVTVSAAREGALWRFSVGAGAPLSGIDSGAFELFGRRAGPGEWSGDLAICRRLIERHGGSVWLEPEADAPTGFAFTLAA